jgi:heme/copper-type cytochrome/quinol oxidase subunit 3
MSEAAAIETRAPAGMDRTEPQLTPGNTGKLGMWIFLVGDAMTFGAAIAAYGALRIGNVNWPRPSDILGIDTTAFMTFVLICSSLTMVKALSGIQHGNVAQLKKYLALTVLGGLIFLGMQAYEWTMLIGYEGLSIKTSLFSATFFALTGFHGMHVFGGVCYNSTILANAIRGYWPGANAKIVEIAGLYWHFVDLVWILIFTFVYLI